MSWTSKGARGAGSASAALAFVLKGLIGCIVFALGNASSNRFKIDNFSQNSLDARRKPTQNRTQQVESR
jgi:hypothetical protein